MTSSSKLTLGDSLRTLQAGIKSNLKVDESLIVGETTYTVPALLGKIDGHLAAQIKTINAKNAFHAAVAEEKASNLDARVLRGQMKGYAVGRYGVANPILAQYGYTPAGPRRMTAATKAVAALKVKATRKARNTLGKKQKAKIKGSVDPAIAAALATRPSAVSPVNEPAVAPVVAAQGPVPRTGTAR